MQSKGGNAKMWPVSVALASKLSTEKLANNSDCLMFIVKMCP